MKNNSTENEVPNDTSNSGVIGNGRYVDFNLDARREYYTLKYSPELRRNLIREQIKEMLDE